MDMTMAETNAQSNDKTEIIFSRKDEDNNEIFVLQVNEKKMGFISINLNSGSIANIWVDEGKRKKGYGTKLVKFAETLLASKGSMVIRTSQINSEVVEFFKKCGYIIDEQEFGTKILSTDF
jgi:GNAT superfamily N-acetyltransferase